MCLSGYGAVIRFPVAILRAAIAQYARRSHRPPSQLFGGTGLDPLVAALLARLAVHFREVDGTIFFH